MWLAKLFSTVLYFDKPILCEKHDSVKLENMSREEIKQSEEIFCVLTYIRKHVMDPFYYNTPYPSAVLGTWFKQLQNNYFKQLEKLPWESSMSWDQLEKEVDLVQLIHDTTTYTLAAMTTVCFLCEKSKGNFTTWVNNTKGDTDLWHSLKEEFIDFNGILKPCSQYGKILEAMYILNPLTFEDRKFFVETVFFVTFMIRYSVFSSESVESILSANQNIMEHTKKFTLEFPIGEHHLKDIEALSQHLTILKGNEKESFSILLHLVKRATISLNLEEYKEAEVYSQALVTLVPSWCKGYFYLATAVYNRVERIHFAHCAASLGLQNCENVLCPTCTTFQSYMEKWQQECSPMCSEPAANKLAIEEYQCTLSELARKNLFNQADDVPELTDPSSSDDSHSESDYDAAQEELPDVSKPVVETKETNAPVIKQKETCNEQTIQKETVQKETIQEEAIQKEIMQEEDIQKGTIQEEVLLAILKETVLNKAGLKDVIQNKITQEETLELKQSSNSKEHNMKENDSSVTRHTPVKLKKSVPEQNEVVKPPPKPSKEADPKPPKNYPKKVEKARHKKEPSDETLSAAENNEKMERFKILLKEGSAAMTDGCGLSAVRNFYDSLSEFKSNPTLYKLEEYEIVCLKYAYGTACCKSGTYEDLNKAITAFNEILNDYSNVRFPVAYYGLGLVYFRLNKFKEALSHFEMLQSMIDKGIQCTVYSWPGTVIAIEETKTEKLKILLNDLVAKCRSPPVPAALCRHENCLSRPEIYYSDPDFKGFTIIQCQDRCVLQYHPSCWKALKDSLNRTDKDFLGQQCLTPDCEFIVMQIECIGKDGTSDKHFEIEDSEKVKKQKKSRLEKRLVLKELKKRRRLESQSASVSESVEVFDNNEDELASESISNVTEQSVVKEIENNELVENEAPKKIESNLSAHAKPFFVRKEGEPLKENVKATYMWKKDAESVCENEKVNKTKERKKAKKPVALSLEEFRQKIQDFSYYSEYQMRLRRLQQNNSIIEDSQTQWSTICETEKIPHLDPNRPFYIPEDLRDDPLALEAVLQSYSSYGKTGCSKVSKEKIYMHLEKILCFYGPMRVDDSVLLEEVANFPAALQQLISDAGGLKDFLLASMRFAFVGDHICVVSDVVQAYSMGTKSYNGEGYSSGCDTLEEYEEAANGINNGDDDDDNFHDHDKFYSYLNPHATEYNPVSPVQSKSSISSGNSNCSSEAYSVDIISAKDVEQESPETFRNNISSINNLREPLLSNGQNFDDLKKNNGAVSEQHLYKSDLNVKSKTPSETSSCFADPDKAFEHLAEDTKKLPDDKKFNMILKILNFVLNEEYYAQNISLFNHHLKPFTFTLIPKKQNKRLQAGTPDINMHSKAVMKEDEHVKALIENFHDLEQYRNNMNAEKKVVEEKLEHALDTIVQLQNALTVAEKDREKKVEEVESLLEEEKKESKKKEKNWEKEQKRFELNQAKINEQLKSYKEEMRSLKDELSKKDTQLKEVEELKKATEIDLANVRKAKSEAETSLHEALQFHEIENSTLIKKLQNAQLELLTTKKNNTLEKITVSSKNAELRLKEIQDGLPMVNHPLFLEQLRSLETQIKEHMVQLGKTHCDFVKAADEQISELKKGKDLSDLQPLMEPVLLDCPALKAPPNATASTAPGSNNLVPGNSSQTHPNVSDLKSLGLMVQTPNSSSAQPGGPIYNTLLNTFTPNQRLAASQGASFHGTSILGNYPGLNGSNVHSVNSYQGQNLGMVNSQSLFDSSLYQNTTSGYYQKPTSSFQPNLPRAHIPPGLSVPIHSSSQGLPNPASNMFHVPQTEQQNTSAASHLLQTPFSFGFPQLPKRTAVTQLDPSGKTVPKTSERSAAETAFINALKKTADEAENRSSLYTKTRSEKSVSRENVSETKSSISNPASFDVIRFPIEKNEDSACSSPVPDQSRNKSNQSDSSRSAPLIGPEPVTVNKQACTSVDLEATGVRLKQPVANTKHKKFGGSSRSGASSVISDYDSLNLDGSVPESSMLELGYTVKASVVKPVPTSSNNGGFAKGVKVVPTKNVPITNSYEKLLTKLMLSYPQHTRTELMECVGEFRKSNNNKLSNLKFGNIISGIGKILDRRRNSVAQTSQKKKPQLQVLSLTRKPAPPPPSEKSGICPWAKPEPQGMSAPWHGDNADSSCSICLEDMTVRCSVKKLECGHRFHLLCLKEWLDKNSNCPICRIHVLLPEDYPSLA